MHDNCDECSTDYTFDPQTDIAVIYLVADTRFNHVFVACPNCQSKATIFLEPATLLTILGEVTLPLRLRSEVPDEVRAMRESVDHPEDPEPPPDGPTHPAAPALAVVPEISDLPEAPREWVQQLLDDLRRFGEGEAA